MYCKDWSWKGCNSYYLYFDDFIFPQIMTLTDLYQIGLLYTHMNLYWPELFEKLQILSNSKYFYFSKLALTTYVPYIMWYDNHFHTSLWNFDFRREKKFYELEKILNNQKLSHKQTNLIWKREKKFLKHSVNTT